MSTYISAIFSSAEKALQALGKLWSLNDEGAVIVHSAYLVQPDDRGHMRVVDHSTEIGMRTAVGVGIGALLGLIAGPAGVAAGVAGASALSIGAATGVGALVVGAIGVTADAAAKTQRETAAEAAVLTVKPGQSVVIAEITEASTAVLDEAMQSLGGTLFRRTDDMSPAPSAP